MEQSETMGEFFNAFKEHNREQRQVQKDKYLPLILKLGAIQKSDGVYELENWLIYPTKGFCMDKKNTTKRISINKFLMKKEK